MTITTFDLVLFGGAVALILLGMAIARFPRRGSRVRSVVGVVSIFLGLLVAGVTLILAAIRSFA